MNSTVFWLAMTLAACPRVTPEQTKPLKEALRAGLSWHYRWMERFPSGVDAIRCTVAHFEERSFAFCTPGPLELDVEVEKPASPHVTNIVHVHGTFETILGQFRNNLRPGSEIRRKEEISIAADDLLRCDVDWHRTRQAPGAALNERQLVSLRTKGLTLRYPLVCEGDPFYLIYLMRGEEVWSIWKFVFNPEELSLNWTYDSDNSQRRIPERAIQKLGERVWYEVGK